MNSKVRPVRIGMIVPSSNTCLEPQTASLLGGRRDVSVHYTRIPVTHISLDQDSTHQFDREVMAEAAQLLATAEVDVIAWNGTSGSWLGLTGDHEISDLITEVTGIRATTTTLAFFEAFRVLNISRIGLLTPYTEDVNKQIVERYAENGIQVVDDYYSDLAVNESFARVTPAEITKGTEALAAQRPQAVTYVCTNLFGAPVVSRLERRLDVDILDSVVVTLWQCLRVTGAAGVDPRWGRRLAETPD